MVIGLPYVVTGQSTSATQLLPNKNNDEFAMQLKHSVI